MHVEGMEVMLHIFSHCHTPGEDFICSWGQYFVPTGCEAGWAQSVLYTVLMFAGKQITSCIPLTQKFKTQFKPKRAELHGHFLSTCPLPPSSYSWLEIHICWKVPMDAKMEPPIQAPNRRSAQPLALISLRRMLDGIRMDRSRFKRSGNPCVTILPM